MKHRPRFVVELEAVPVLVRPGDPEPAPPALRLRAALKTLLRRYQLQCRSLREVPK